jgi:hypothetical protein
MKKSLFALIAGIASTTLALSTPAEAATVYGVSVATIQYDNSPRLTVWADNAIHYAFGSAWGANCGTVSAESLRHFEAMFQAALLSGKKVDIDYTTNTSCTGSSIRIITAVRLQSN